MNWHIFLAVLLFAWAPARAELNPMAVTEGSGQAVEGDMLSVNGSVVKLWGVDAPDAGQICRRASGAEYDCFQSARQALARLVDNRSIECHIRGKDSYGQSVGTCGVNGYDVAALMIRDGWAMAYQSLSPQYARLEGQAQALKVGLWAGRAESPWSWRMLEKKQP